MKEKNLPTKVPKHQRAFAKRRLRKAKCASQSEYDADRRLVMTRTANDYWNW